MTIAANLASQSTNWSGGALGSGTLSLGHSDENPAYACPADANDANAYVEGSCTGINTGTANQRRTNSLSNGAIIWDIGGNIWQWIDYNNSSDKPTPYDYSWYEFTAITGSATTPRSHMIPSNSTQSWWNDTWNSSKGIGQIITGENENGGALRRGGRWDHGAGWQGGPFTMILAGPSSDANSGISFRCAYQPSVYHLNYDSNGASSGSVPSDTSSYNDGDPVTVLGNTGSDSVVTEPITAC